MLGLEALLTKDALGDEDALWIETVKNNVGIALVAGGEHDQLEVFGEILEELFGIGADVDTCLDDLAVWEGDGDLEVADVFGIVAVD